MGIQIEPAEAFGKVLRELRLKKGLTQEQLGFEAEVRRTFVSVLELGEQQPSITTIIKLSRALGVRAGDMVAKVEALLD